MSPEIIVLIISTEEDVYQQKAKNCWRRYMNSNVNIKSFFIEWCPTLVEQYKIDHETSTIYLAGHENFIPGIFLKRMNTMSLALQQFPACKFVIHTNLSSVWNWRVLLEKLGYIGSRENKFMDSPVTDFFKGHMINNASIMSDPYPSGCGFILSRNVADRILRAAQSLYNPVSEGSRPEFVYYDDDVMFGKLLRHIGFNNNNNDGAYLHYHYATDEEKQNVAGFYHIRCRIDGLSQPERAEKEIPLINRIIDDIYSHQ